MAENPTRLKLPSPDARVARSPFEGRDQSALFATGGVASTGTLTLALNVANTETVTIGTKVYTFQTVLTDVDGNVLIGADAEESLDNLIAAINLDAGAGTLYAASMTEHPDVTAAAGVGDTMDVTAKVKGSGGDAIATTETLAGAGNQWGAVTLENGVDPDGAVAFVPIVQWGAIRIRIRLSGADGTLDVDFARPSRQIAPGTGVDAFVYTVDLPSIDGTALADGVEQSLEIPATEHIGENWLRLTVNAELADATLDFLDISGELLGLYH